MQVIITGRVADSAGTLENGRIEFAQAQRLDTGDLLVTSSLAVAQVVEGELRTPLGLPFQLPANPEGTAVRVREILGGQTFEWWTAVPEAESVEYRELPIMESSSVPASVWGPPLWVSQVLQAKDETIAAIEDGLEAVNALGGVAGLNAIAAEAAASASSASASSATAVDAAARAEATAESVDVEAITNLVQAGDAATLAEAKAFAQGQNGFVSVLNYGAVADGVTDCTAAVEAAAREVERRGGGCLLFPPGKYRQDGFVRLSSNTHVLGYGATILKTFPTGAGFTSIAFGALGGSGWVYNISIFGLAFQGKLPNNGVMALWAHRLQGLTVRHVRAYDSVKNGHVFDLMGVTDFIFEDCLFSGAKDPDGGREYAEAIQLDASAYGGSPLTSQNYTETFDGTATSRGTIARCRFVKQGEFLAPRAVGCHSAVENNPYTDILIEKNYIETPQNSSGWTSVLNFTNTDGITVRNNTFNIANGTPFPMLVNFSAADTWMKLSDVNTPGAPHVPANGGALSRNKVVHSNRSRSSHPITTTATEKLLNYHAILKDYSAGQAPAIQVSENMVELTGAFTLVSGTATQSGITAAGGIVAAKLPPGLYPSRTVPAVCQGVGNNTFLTEVRTNGDVVIMRYPDGAATNLWLSFGITWTRQ